MDRRISSIVGKRFGRLTVASLQWNGTQKRNYALCQCDCGESKLINISNLRKGATTSCGCYHKEQAKKALLTHGLSKTRIHKEWRGIKGRCNKITTSHYDRYGGRGILLCDEWNDDFMAFYEWSMQNGYQNNFTIDRIDNDGDYRPSNCRWVPHIINTHNRGMFSTNTSGCTGVTWDRDKKLWRSNIMVNGKNIYLGRYKDFGEAVKARKKGEEIYFKAGDERLLFNLRR